MTICCEKGKMFQTAIQGLEEVDDVGIQLSGENCRGAGGGKITLTGAQRAGKRK